MAESPNHMQIQAAIAQLHASPFMAYIVTTGAGAGVTQMLWSVPGCSRTLIGSEFPYHAGAFADLLGRDPAQHTSPESAVALAAAAYLKGQKCLVETEQLGTPIIGIGLTAAVATDRVRRGEDKAFLAVRTATKVATVSVLFDRGRLRREDEGQICDLIALDGLLWAADLNQVSLPHAGLRSSEVSNTGALRPRALSSSIDRGELPLLIDQDGQVSGIAPLSPSTHVLFPGSFNPLHFGHDAIARAVAAMTGKQVVFELAGANADKPEIDREALGLRALQFRGRWPVLLSESLPLFIDKARAYGGFGFIIGLDTAPRLIDPIYFGGEPQRDAVLAELKALGTVFYVCDRGDDRSALDRAVNDPLVRSLFVPVPLRFTVSSSELRAAAAGGGA